AQSCNIFFYEAGLKVGGAAIVKYASTFGFGQPTAIDLPGEKSGLLPRPQTVRNRQGKTMAFPPGETVNMSIGQGTVLVTPMQIARFMAAVSNGGVLCRPRLLPPVARPHQVVWSGSSARIRSSRVIRGRWPDTWSSPRWSGHSCARACGRS